MKWSPIQQEAIDTRNKNILVAAAAGSGKTAVLVERIKQLILKDKVDIDKMLIVTFTNAAAAEMKERISNAIVEELEKNNKDDFLAQQLNKLGRANISTFHSFCIEVIRRYFYLIEIEPNFKICDEAQKAIMQEEAIEEVFEDEYDKENESFMDFIDKYSGGRNDDDSKEIVLSTYGFIQSIPDPLQWLERNVDSLLLNNRKYKESIFKKRVDEEVSDALKMAVESLKRATEICNDDDGPIAYKELITLEHESFSIINKMFDNKDDTYISALRNFEFINMPRQNNSVNQTKKNTVKSLRDNTKKAIEKILSNYLLLNEGDYVDELNYSGESGITLLNLVRAFDNRFKEKKQGKGLLDFNDLEHYGLEILSNIEAAKEYKEKFEYLFVDEYQDSNIVQETLIEYIKRENNVFRVGDVKQSIYRFRLADPSLFINRYNNYKIGSTETDIKIDLNKNYRSKKNIINGTNYIFKNLINKEVGEIDYDEDAYLYQGVENTEEYDFPVKVHLVDNKDVDNEVDDEIKDMKKVELEAYIAVKEIKSMLGKKIFDNKYGVEREVQYKDIVILLRTVKKWVNIYYEMLLKNDIPVYIDDGEGYFDTMEIGIFLNLVAVIDNFYQDIPLLSVLRSEIGKFATEELIQIRLENKDMEFNIAFDNYIENGTDETIKKKCLEFKAQIVEWKKKATYLTIEDFLWKLLHETGYYQYISALPGGVQRQANIKLLIDKAKIFQSNSMKGIFNFLKFMEQIKKSNTKVNTGKVINENDNVVKIMSIHKSKGLEFPVVILGGLGKKFNYSSGLAKIVCHKDIGIGLTIINRKMNVSGNTVVHKIIKRKQKIESVAEEMRILYVAFTRAKDKLILLGSLANVEKKYDKWLYQDNNKIIDATNPIDWLMPILLRKQNVDDAFCEIYGLEPEVESYDDDGSKWELEVSNRGIIKGVENKKNNGSLNISRQFENGFEIKDEAISKYVNERLDYQYKYKEETSLPSKLSVTELKKIISEGTDIADNDFNIVAKTPLFLKGKKEYGPMEKGTLMHLVMQHIPLHKEISIDAVKEQIDILISKELIDEEESKHINVNLVNEFFTTDLGQRMIASEEVGREEHFNLLKPVKEILIDKQETGNIIIQGTIDNYFKENDGYVLIDYKTDYINSSENSKKINETIDKYKIQLDLYKGALEEIKGVKVKEKYIYFFSIGKYFMVN